MLPPGTAELMSQSRLHGGFLIATSTLNITKDEGPVQVLGKAFFWVVYRLAPTGIS